MKLLSFKKREPYPEREPQPAAPVLSEELAPEATSSETACSPAAVAAPAEAVPGEGDRVLSAGEAAQYREFLRRKREEELSFMLRRLIADLTSVSDGACLCAGVEDAVRLGASGVLVTPDQLSFVRKQLKSGGKGAQRGDQNSADAPRLFALVGGTGDTLPAVKKYEVKKAVRLGADALVLLPSVMLFRGGTVQAAKREWRPVLRAAGKRGVFVALTDPRLKREEVLSGCRCRCEGGGAAFGLCGRGGKRRAARSAPEGGRGACVHGTAGTHRKRARSAGGGVSWRMSGCILFRDGEGPAPCAFLGQKARGASKKIHVGRRRRGKVPCPRRVFLLQ